MPRNGSGTMNVPNSFSPATTISSSAVNANFADAATELTNSLPRDGQAAMTGQFKAATGTASAPGISFGSDTNTGFYRKSADVIGVVCGGSEVATITAATGGGVVDALPSGTSMLFAQTAAPTGWTKSTAHDDKALRVVSGTASSGGSTAFTSVFSARTILEENLPSHTHDVTGSTGAEGAHTHPFSATTGTDSGDHQHVINLPLGTPQTVAAGASFNVATQVNTNYTTGNENSTHTHPVSGTTSAGSSHSHPINFTSGATGSGTALDFAVQYVDVIIAVKD